MAWKPLAILALLLVVGASQPATAWAHAELDRADPAPGSDLDQPPAQLQLFFSEAVDPSFSRVQLLNDKGDAVDQGDSHVAPDDPRSLIVSLPSALDNGVYTVSWRTLSAVDGHQVTGAYPLILGPMPAEGLPATTTASSQAVFSNETAVSRWWFSLTASLLFGTLLSWHLVFRRLFGRANPGALPVAAARARKLAIWAGILLLAGTLYGALAQASASAGVPLWGVLGSPLGDLLSRGRFASLWWPRLGLVALTLALVSWRGVEGWWGRIALIAVGLSLLTTSTSSGS
jgi:copper transport protein